MYWTAAAQESTLRQGKDQIPDSHSRSPGSRRPSLRLRSLSLPSVIEPGSLQYGRWAVEVPGLSHVQEEEDPNPNSVDDDVPVSPHQAPAAPYKEPPQTKRALRWIVLTGAAVVECPLDHMLLHRISPLPSEHIRSTAVLIDYCVPNASYSTSTKPLSWMHVLPDLPGVTETLRLAVSALMHARVGSVERRSDIAKDGLRLYIRALEALRRTLKQSAGALSIATFAATLILALYEMLQPTGDATSWCKHMDGLESLLQARGPGQHVAGASHHLFVGYRATGVTFISCPSKPSSLTRSWRKTVATGHHSTESYFPGQHRMADRSMEHPAQKPLSRAARPRYRAPGDSRKDRQAPSPQPQPTCLSPTTMRHHGPVGPEREVPEMGNRLGSS
ncbi:hypothetical protein BP5796_06757 [Coleophoma crateriformis]|uniref:Transcription factor domain-containing protein n=1 Tax=Coleophoma crateriformis TaxID=565419 RepID=A0A3D8RPQ9_9HELO|nr:hypothetical protein BP5796_06757 [Coleophoma crateriformis]